MQNTYSLQCTNCGGITKIEYTGQPIAPNLACKYCGSPLQVPEQLTRATSPDAWREGLLRAIEQAVENADEIQTARTTFQQSSVHVYQAGVPTASAVKKTGCLIGGISTASCLITLLVTIITVAVPLIAVTTSMGGVSNLLDNVNSQISDITGSNTVESGRSFQGPTFAPDLLRYSPDGKLIAGTSSDGIFLWSVQSGAKVAVIEQNFSTNSLFFTPDSQQIVTNDGTAMTFYATSDGHVLRQFDCRCSSFGQSPDGTTLVYNNYSDEMLLVSADDGSVIRRLDATDAYLSHLLFSPDGRFVVGASSGSTLFVWDTTTGREVFGGETNATSTDVLAFHPHQNTLVIGRNDTLEFYDVDESGLHFVRTQKVNETFFSIQGLAYSPDGNEIAMGNFFDDVWIWNIADKKIVKKLKSDMGISSVAYSPDGNFVIGAGSRGDVLEWQLRETSGDGIAPPTVAPTLIPPTAFRSPTPPPADARTATPAAVNPLLKSICTITPTGSTARIRSGPSTGDSVTGTLTGSATANAQRTGSDGFRWWKLLDGSGWVREDVVNETSGCATLPQE